MPVGRHWLALRSLRSASPANGKSSQTWADVDSDLDHPVILDGEDAVVDRLHMAFRDVDCHLIIVKAYFPHTVR